MDRHHLRGVVPDYSQVDVLGFRYKPVNFSTKTNPGSPTLVRPKRERNKERQEKERVREKERGKEEGREGERERESGRGREGGRERARRGVGRGQGPGPGRARLEGERAPRVGISSIVFGVRAATFLVGVEVDVIDNERRHLVVHHPCGVVPHRRHQPARNVAYKNRRTFEQKQKDS